MGFRDETYCRQVKQVPTEKHLAVLVDSSYSTPDYWNEGHCGTDYKIDYIVFANEASLKEWILANPTKVYRVVEVTPKTIKQEIILE